MKKVLLPGLFILSVFAGRWYLFSPRTAELPAYNYLSCVGEAKDVDATYEADVLFVKRALPETSNSEIFWAGANRLNSFVFENQTRYAPSDFKAIGVGEDIRIDILGTTEVGYPQSLTFRPSSQEHFYPFGDADYVRNLYSLGKVEEGEAAIKVRVRISQNIHLCRSDKSPVVPEDLRLFAPADPYLAFSYYPLSAWPRLWKANEKKAVVHNPCSEAELLPRIPEKWNPLAFAFSWRPFVEGRSYDKTSFDCRESYRLGENVFEVKPRFVPRLDKKVTDIDFGAFKDLNRPIKATAFFGALRSFSFRPMDPVVVKALVESYLLPIGDSEARRKLPIGDENFDLALSRVLIFLRNVSAVIEPHSREVHVTPLSIGVSIRGKFKLSKKDLDLFVHFSPISPDFPGYDIFAQAVEERLLQSDIFIYEGHNHGGKPLRATLNRLKEKYHGALPTGAPEYQLVAMLSCSANGVYHRSNFPKPPGMRRDFVYGLSSYLDIPGHGVLSFITAADKFAYNGRIPHFGNWASAHKSDNLYLLVNHRD